MLGVCMYGFCNVWVCVWWGGCVCMCGFCNVWVCVWVCVCMGFVMYGCVNVWVCNEWMCVCVGFVMCGCFGNMCTCIYSVFVLFRLCIFILFRS
jgi:hypothetical protein